MLVSMKSEHLEGPRSIWVSKLGRCTVYTGEQGSDGDSSTANSPPGVTVDHMHEAFQDLQAELFLGTASGDATIAAQVTITAA